MSGSEFDKLHPYTEAGFGSGPFMYESADAAGGHCMLCGQAIVYRHHLRAQSGETFWVGSTCIEKRYGARAKEEIKRLRNERLYGSQDIQNAARLMFNKEILLQRARSNDEYAARLRSRHAAKSGIIWDGKFR
jgi:hypothetical protein